jgi:predicted ATPase
LRSLQDAVGNLPAQLTSFVGRDEELAGLVDALHHARLVTLTGTGGVGKTRLALQVAADLEPDFTDGAWVCELAAADDDLLMAQVIANAIGCKQRPGLSLADSIVDFLKVRNLLLVLDNCEHLLDDAGDLAAAVLRRCPDVRVLATSREALEVDGERVVRVRSLPEDAAVRMFDDRARDAGADAGWTNEQGAAIAEICRRVDGIPLAIELAAARVEAMSPTEIAAHLDERFRILTGKRRGRLERQQTLRATVDWSYQLLEPEERTVFDRLGIFSGSFDAEAASAVVSDDALDPWQVHDAVAGLVAKSMLVAEDGPGGTTRYTMLETLRVFARDQLDQSDDADVWRRRHAANVASFAEAFSVGTQGPDCLLWSARLMANLDNVRAAVSWALDRDDPADSALAIRCLVALTSVGQWNRSIMIDRMAVRAIEVVADGPAEWRAPVLALASYHELNRGRAERGLELARASMRDGIVWEAILPSFPVQNLIFVELMVGHRDEANALIDEGRAAFADADPYVEAAFLSAAGTFFALLGRYDDARAASERAVALGRQLGSHAILVHGLSSLAWSLQRADPEAALACIDELLVLNADNQYSGILCTALALGGGLRARLDDQAGAFSWLHRAALIARDEGVRPQLGSVLDWSVVPLLRTGRADVAVVFLGILTQGALADVSNYLLTGAYSREQALDRLRMEVDDVEALIDVGAGLSYDEVVDYVLEQLSP